MKELLEDIAAVIEKRNISSQQIAEILQSKKDIVNRRIIGGYSSVAIVDREGQKIPISALRDAAAKFMQNIFARPAMVFHSDVQVGRVLPKWTNPDTGETIESKVDDIGWFTVIEIRDDIEIANKTWEEVLKGNIRSFSIAGSSKDKLQKQAYGQNFEQVNELEIYETTLCEVPVNQQSKFEVLWNPNRVAW
jgi:Caudovirus prohead serine protease